MAKSDYLSPNDESFAAQLQTFKNTVGAYSVMLGLSPAQVTAQAADADYFQYVLACQSIMRNGGVQWLVGGAACQSFRSSASNRGSPRMESQSESFSSHSRWPNPSWIALSK